MGWAKNPGCIERGKCKQGSSHRAGRQSKERDFFKGENWVNMEQETLGVTEVVGGLGHRGA